jgi:hypothetical protein
MRTLLKTIAITIAGIVALTLLLYYAVFFVNLHDREPSALSRQMEQGYRTRPAIAEAENGYAYLMGSAAALGPYREPSDPVLSTFRKACLLGAPAECADAFVHGDDLYERWTAADGDLLQQYSQLIAHSGWMETGPVDSAAPIPPYSRFMDGQRFSLLHVRWLVHERNYDAAHRLLESDLRFWRHVLESADILISKMIATAALVRHFELGNLILRDLDPQTAALVMPADWRVPLTNAERSLRRCMVGEWMMTSGLARSLEGYYRPEVAEEIANKDGHWGRRLFASVARPLYQPQDSINRYAEVYFHLGELLDAPLDRYEEARAAAAGFSARTAEDAWPPRSLYNVLGSWILSEAITDYSKYGARIADIEGVRRAALAAVTLRAAKVDAADVARALATSDLRNPYHGRPFVWSATDSAIQFIGLAPGERGVHLLYY